MSIDELIRSGKVREFKATTDEIKKPLEIAERDITFAENIVSKNLDWSLNITYNAVLQACRGYMFFLGYRPASYEAHKNVFQFMEVVVSEDYKDIVSYFDRIRKKRHRTMYDEVGLVSEKEAKEAFQMAKKFVKTIQKWINETNG